MMFQDYVPDMNFGGKKVLSTEVHLPIRVLEEVSSKSQI
jgi:hypothetical protein